MRPDNAETRAEIARIERGSGGVVSLACEDLDTGERVEYLPNRRVRTASVVKVPILVHVAMLVQEGNLRWNDVHRFTDADKVGGSGILTTLDADRDLSIRDLATLMTIISDNSATNLLIDHVGVEAINARCESLGLNATRLFRKIGVEGPPISPDNEQFGIAVTSPNDMVRLLKLLAERSLGDCASDATLAILAKQQLLNAIPRLLPPEWKYAGKTGSLDLLRNDVGIVTSPNGRRFAIAVFVQELPEVRWTADNPGLLAIARLTRLLVVDQLHVEPLKRVGALEA